MKKFYIKEEINGSFGVAIYRNELAVSKRGVLFCGDELCPSWGHPKLLDSEFGLEDEAVHYRFKEVYTYKSLEQLKAHLKEALTEAQRATVSVHTGGLSLDKALHLEIRKMQGDISRLQTQMESVQGQECCCYVRGENE